MNKTAVAPGVYFNKESSRYSYRPWVHGRRTERLLKATTLKEALREYHKRLNEAESDHSIAELAEFYLKAGAPSRAGASRDDEFAAGERGRINALLPFWGKFLASEIRISHCLAYKDWRVKRVRAGCSGLRTVDWDLTTLSNVLHYAVLAGEVDANRISGRPKFRTTVSHCKDHCPRSGDELHLLANRLMGHWASQVLAWQMVFEACSGCRTNEALSLRWKAAPGEPGHIREGRYLCIARLKQGDEDPFDYIVMNSALKVVTEALKFWNGGKSDWFFPSANGESHVSSSALAHALRRITPKLLPGRRITSHGMRAFYVTWRRISGIPVAQIAEEIGHRSGIGLIYTTYGRKPPPWATKECQPTPKKCEAVWEQWLKPKGNIFRLAV